MGRQITKAGDRADQNHSSDRHSRWASNVDFVFRRDSDPRDVTGSKIMRKSGRRLIISAVMSAFNLEGTEFPQESVRMSGAEPASVSGLSATEVNAGPNALVFELKAETSSGGSSLIIQVCKAPLGSGADAFLRRQYRGLLFYKFDVPFGMYAQDTTIPTQIRNGMRHRVGCPPELATPFFECYGTTDTGPVYVFTSEKVQGFELNRLSGNFTSNPPGAINANEAESLAIGREIIRVYSQLYACTYDPRTNQGFTPIGLNINNGDVVVEKGDLMKPKIHVVAINDVFPSSPGCLVDMLFSPRNINPERAVMANSLVIAPAAENLPHVRDAVAAGIKPLFPTHADDMALSWLKTYAGEQERLFDDAVKQMSQLSSAVDKGPRELKRVLPDASGRFGSNRITQNPYFFTELAWPLSQRIREGSVLSTDEITEKAEGIRKLVCPPEFLQAIKEM